MKRALLFVVALVLAATMSAPAWAQRIDGDLRGEVKDQTGAIIPGAKITVTSESTGTSRSVETTDAGIFFVGNLLPGRYTVEVESAGFQRYVRRGVQVLANRVSEVIVNMELGEVTSTVEVVAGAEQVQTSTATLVGATFKDELAGAVTAAGNLGGDPINLAISAPGTTTQSGGVVGTGGSIGGNRPRQNNFVIDGLDNNDPSVTGPLTDVISDAVEEFTLLTNQFTAEYGHSTAGQFITTTKSGTNEIHGRGWLYVQNRNLNALDNLTRSTTMPGDPKPKFDWQRYGGQGGGPIIKDKIFIFGSYERHELDLAATPGGIINVPTSAGFAAIQALASDPNSGISPVNANIILNNVPTASSASASTNVCNVGLDATCASGGLGDTVIELGAFQASTPVFRREHRFLISADANLGQHRISGRFHYQQFRSAGSGELPVQQFNHDVVFDPRRTTISDVWTISPTVLNEFRFAYLRNINGFVLPNLPSAPGSTDIFANYNMPDINLFVGPQSNLPQGGFDNIYQATDNVTWVKGAHTMKFGVEYRSIISGSDFLPRSRGEYEWVGVSALGHLSDMDAFLRDYFPSSVSIRGVGLSLFAQNRQSIYWFAQDSWKIHPRVTVEFGLRYEYTQVARDAALQNQNGIANIVDLQSEVWTAELAAACGDSVGGCITPYDGSTTGLATSLIGTSIFASLPTRHQQALLAHVGNSLIFQKPSSDGNNFGPRLGLAWDVFGDGKTALRGGFAIAHDVFFGNLPLLQLPPQAQAENRETNACSLNPAPGWCAGVSGAPASSPGINFLTGTGFIEGGALLNVQPFDAANDRVLARALTGAYVNPEISPEVYTWSLALQHETWRNLVAEARYVGTRGVHLPIQRWVSARIPNPFRIPAFGSMSEVPTSFSAGDPTLADFFNNRDLMLWPFGFQGVITQFSSDGQSWYHGGSISLKGDIGYGFYFNTNYTWSRTIDFIENDLFTSFMNPRRPWDMIDIRESKGLSGLHHEHKYVFNWIWSVPGYNGDSGVLRRLTRGWGISGTYIAETGQPLTPLSRRDTNGDFDTAGDRAFFNTGASDRSAGTDVNSVCFEAGVVFVAGVGGNPPCASSATTFGYVTADATAGFVRPGTGSFPTGSLVQLGRNTLGSPGINTWHFTFSKDTPFWGEGRVIRFQADFINAFNHPSFGIGTGTVFNSTANATGFPNYVTPGTSQFRDETIFSGGQGQNPFQRVIQLSLKVIF